MIFNRTEQNRTEQNRTEQNRTEQNRKIITPEEFGSMRAELKQAGKKVVLCHGVFDLLHYGHIEHLTEARRQGDVLVVSVTAGKYVNKGPNRPYFNDEQRLAFLASLEMVDYVLLSEAVTVHHIIEYVQPDLYVKGQEYAVAANDVTGNIGSEEKMVEQYGGKIYFTAGEVHSSTHLLNNYFSALPPAVFEYSKALNAKYGTELFAQIKAMTDAFSKLKVLVIGDVIIDRYVFCRMQGLTSKDNVISTKQEYAEDYPGGALAIAKHIKNFTDSVTFLSMIGSEVGIADYITANMQGIDCKLLETKNFITPLKTRFLKQNKIRQEYEKLFSVNQLLDLKQMRAVDYTHFIKELTELLPQYDCIVICDYGHGIMCEEVVRTIEAKAGYLAVNCQTNSSNYGMNIITKYQRADCFVVDERELHLPFGQSLAENDELLPKLMNRLGSETAWVTLGANGALGICGKEQAEIPAVTLQVKDTVGAGDAFYALAVLCAKAGMPADLATLIANVAGAIKTNRLGNSRSVEKTDVLKFLSTILNV